MSWEYITLFVIFGISYLGHNASVAWAAGILIAMKALGLSNLFPAIEANGLNWGIILLTLALLVPVATGKITLPIMLHAFQTPIGIIAILAGVFASVSGGMGIQLLKASPEVISSLIVGTMIGVFFWKGITVGPLIAGGIVYMVCTLGNLLR